jgi:hypothetical protein
LLGCPQLGQGIYDMKNQYRQMKYDATVSGEFLFNSTVTSPAHNFSEKEDTMPVSFAHLFPPTPRKNIRMTFTEMWSQARFAAICPKKRIKTSCYSS